MQIRTISLALAFLAITASCGFNKTNEDPSTLSEVSGQADEAALPSEALDVDGGVEVVVDPSNEQLEGIEQRNEAILARLRDEELARAAQRVSQEETRQPIESGASQVSAPVSPAADLRAEIPPRSSMEEFQARVAEFEPRMAEIARVADLLDDNYRRYIDACYQKYTTAESSGSFSGRARGSSHGVVAGRDWFVVYGAESQMAYQGSYTESTAVNNETTAYCRELWSDVVDGAREINASMRSVQEEARRRGVLPGHLRDLRRRFRLDWEGWTR